MTILLTRPEGRNSAMISALESCGVAYIVTPLLRIEATQHPLPFAISQFDFIIFISTNAVHYAQPILQAIKDSQCQCYAVGQATFDALKQQGINARQAPQDNQKTEGLLSLPELQDLSNQKMLIVRGVGGRETLAEQLTVRGAEVNYWEVYQRICPQLDSQQICTAWRDAKVDTIIATSGAILDNLIALTPKELFSWLFACHIIVPSSRIAAQAQQVGFNRVTNAKAADTKTMLIALGLSHSEY